ncbi:MAG: siderophore-interacting protein [Thermoactinospora sp.]|nr:siderophore-interacting protein [Thermoactinospora sp.]
MPRLPIRALEVTRVRSLSPGMARVTFTADDLTGLPQTGPDQQVKLYFPRPGQDAPLLPDPDGELMSWYAAFTAIPEQERPWMRSFTLRARGHDTVDIDFVLHGSDGPASRWAMRARPSHRLAMFGPSADFARPVPLDRDLAEADWVLLAGDLSALPAIGTLMEALPYGKRAEVFVEAGDPRDRQEPPTRGAVTLHWTDGGALVDTVTRAQFPGGRVFAWLAGEASAVRRLRRHLVAERGIAKSAVDFSGYWRRTLTQDDAPTGEDLADAQDLLARAQELQARS